MHQYFSILIIVKGNIGILWAEIEKKIREIASVSIIVRNKGKVVLFQLL